MVLIPVRDARAGDLPAILDIYNEAVLSTTATFDTEPRCPEAQEAWFRAHGSGHPVLLDVHLLELIL